MRTALEEYFNKRSRPKITLGFLLILTGLIGFLISFTLLHLGLDHMYIRYPVAVLGAYVAFLAMIRIWVEVERSKFDPDAPELKNALADTDISVYPTTLLPRTSPQRSDHGSWLEWLDFSAVDVFDFEAGCLGAILVAALIGLITFLIVTIVDAPALLSEVFLDAFLVSALYRRLRIASKEHWLGTAIRKTWITAVCIAAVLAFVGWFLQRLAPETRSIGPAIQRICYPDE